MPTFTQILNLSISATPLVLAVAAVHLLLRKAPKSFHCALWALVALRLLCPFSLESQLSLVPSREVIPEHYLSQKLPQESLDDVVVFEPVTNPNYHAPIRLETEATVQSVQQNDQLGTWLWMAGMALMGLYALWCYGSLRWRVRMAARLEPQVWECDEVATPFILGFGKPRIYLPSGMDELTRHHVLSHEKAHLKRLDHLWKPLGYVLLTFHWFNPIMWLGYWMLCRDIELACDEKVISTLDRQGVCRYSEALLRCSIRRKHILACPLAFGAVGVKGRVKTMLNYKKPGFWMVVVAIVISVALAGCFLTDPVSESGQESASGQVVASGQVADSQTIHTGIYLPENLEALDPVRLILQADGSAWFNYNLSSANGACTYTLTDTTLTLTSKSGSSRWTFAVENGTFRFQEQNSDGKRYLSKGRGLKNLPDGTRFVYADAETLAVLPIVPMEEIIPEPAEELLKVADYDPESLLGENDICSVEPWSCNWPIDTGELDRLTDDTDVTYPVGLYQVWGHADSDLWVTGIRSAGDHVDITLDFTHSNGLMGEIVLPYSPTDVNAPKLTGDKVTEVGSGDSFVVTLTREEYQSGYVWVHFENMYHVKYLEPLLNPQLCPLIPGTEIYDAKGGRYGSDTPTITLYPDGTALYTSGFSLVNYVCTYTRTEDSLILHAENCWSDMDDLEWVFDLEDGVLRFRWEESDEMEYWGTNSMYQMENENAFVLRNTIDSLDIAIWTAIYNQNHRPGEIGTVGYRILDAFEASNGHITAQVCYEYCTATFGDGRVSGMKNNSMFCASITFDPADGYRVINYQEAYFMNDLTGLLSETALEAKEDAFFHVGDFMSECRIQALNWLPEEE